MFSGRLFHKLKKEEANCRRVSVEVQITLIPQTVRSEGHGQIAKTTKDVSSSTP